MRGMTPMALEMAPEIPADTTTGYRAELGSWHSDTEHTDWQ